MNYTFSSTAFPATSGGVATASMNIGAGNSPFVILAIGLQNGTAPSSVTVGGVSLTKAISDANNLTQIWYGVATGQSGAVNVSVSGLGASENEGFCLWYSATAATVNQTAGTTATPGTTITLGVNNGDGLFSCSRSGGSVTFDLSSVVPTDEHVMSSSNPSSDAGAWNIAATNASFNVVTDQTGTAVSVNHCAASFTPVGVVKNLVLMASTVIQ